MKQLAVSTSFKVLILIFLFFGLYYFLFIRPELQIPELLNRYEQVLTENHGNLLQSRVSIVEINQLTDDSIDVQYELERLIVLLRESQIKGLELSEKYDRIPITKLGTSELIKAVQENLSNIIPDLLKRTNNYYMAEEKLVGELEGFNNITKKILEYDPDLDFGKLELTDQTESAMTKANAAVTGLRNIQSNLNVLWGNNIPLEKESTKLNERFDLTVGNYQVLISYLSNNDIEGARTQLERVVSSYASLKNTTLDTSKYILQQESSVEMITEMTNLIYEYDFLLDQIEILRAETGKIVT